MRKKTKIVATISDKNCTVELIKDLRKAGMNVVRLNTAHQSHEESLKVINTVRTVSERIAILLDTKGPEIRTTRAEEAIPVKNGQMICMKGGPGLLTTPECVFVSYENFASDVPIGSRILIDDGDIELIVREKREDMLVCEVRNDGKIEGRKSVNIPSVHVKLPTLSKKDIDYIYFAIEQDLDFIAHSFVRKKEDVIAIQNILDEKNSKIKIIAKIENQEGVDNIDEILDHVYGIMVARGDLAVEIPQEQIPVIQKMLINKCIARRKPVITATQMLHSMITNPRPTRAEVSDVANAIFDGTDAIMLSGETAYGEYPVRAVEVMTKIALQVEANKEPIKETPYLIINNEVSAFLAISAVRASLELKTEAIIADTETGRTIRALAAYRGRNIIFAQCYSKRVMRELALTYGVFVNYMDKGSSHDEFIYHALQSLKTKNNINDTDLVVVLGGNFGSVDGASFMEIGSVENMVKKTQKLFADWRNR